MAGIYLHIPFCRKICHYCDFHKSASLTAKRDMIDSMLAELEIRKKYPEGEAIETIYFGGGTPTVLSCGELEVLLKGIYNLFSVSGDAEITIEANPDDIDAWYAACLLKTGFNRISVGVQSFNEDELLLLNRRHTAIQAKASVVEANRAGFENISVDLIYGIPRSGPEKLSKTIRETINLPVTHISAYHLSIEKGTAFERFRKVGKIKEIGEESSLQQYMYVTGQLTERGFSHYEVSSFGKTGCFSRHNMGYWKQKKYLGIGPSAHSYNGSSREWNVCNNNTYIRNLQQGVLPSEKEILNKNDRYNEYLITGLRTCWGVDLAYVAKEFGEEYRIRLENSVRAYTVRGLALAEEQRIRLSTGGLFLSDGIISDLLSVN